MASLNKTLRNLFEESTFRLNTDFHLKVAWTHYGDHGYKSIGNYVNLGNNVFNGTGPFRRKSDGLHVLLNVSYQMQVRELPTFRRGLCYILESDQILRFGQSLEISLEVMSEKTKMQNLYFWMTGPYDYLCIAHSRGASINDVD